MPRDTNGRGDVFVDNPAELPPLGEIESIAAPASGAAAIEAPLENNRFAYAPAIAVGTFIAAALGR